MAKKMTNPVIDTFLNEGKIVEVTFIDGKRYKLQHPGNRSKLQWERDYYNPATGIDQEKFLDAAFEHCVIPVGHDYKPDVDSVSSRELGVWQRLLRRFLDGDLEPVLAGSNENPGSKEVERREIQGDKK